MLLEECICYDQYVSKFINENTKVQLGFVLWREGLDIYKFPILYQLGLVFGLLVKQSLFSEFLLCLLCPLLLVTSQCSLI